jgi:4,5-dihydroxyphthalate decarboxylase
MTAPAALRTVLATGSLATPIKQGVVSSPRVRLDFVDVDPVHVHDAFTPMVRNQAYDLCELAIVTCLQAIAYNRPIVVLPVVVASRFQRSCLIAYRPRGVPAAAELAGKRIGVRAYTQTTGMWVRAHLTEDYGLLTPSMRWVTREPAHAEEYSDPAFVELAESNKSLPDMLRDGDIDAAILGRDLPKGEEFAPVIPDAAARDHAWWQQHGFMPINHMMVVSRDASRRDPGVVQAAYDLLGQAYELNAVASGTPNPLRFGFDSLREPLRWIIEACLEQGLLTRRLSLDEVLGPAAELLGRAHA